MEERGSEQVKEYDRRCYLTTANATHETHEITNNIIMHYTLYLVHSVCKWHYFL